MGNSPFAAAMLAAFVAIIVATVGSALAGLAVALSYRVTLWVLA